MTVKLRPWREEDLGQLVLCANDEQVARYMTDQFPHPYSEDNGKRFIQFANSHEPPLILAIEVEGKPVGSIGIHPQADIMRCNAELGYWIARSHWGKGIATAAVPMMVDYAFHHLPVKRIFARPFGNNPASRKVLEKCGFKLEAHFEQTIIKNGEFLDELHFALRRKKE
jgi:RimJ/RimL family protein N-acetyltransferase